MIQKKVCLVPDLPYELIRGLLPRSLMFQTPGSARDDVRRRFLLARSSGMNAFSSLGDIERPETAESTRVRSSVMLFVISGVVYY